MGAAPIVTAASYDPSSVDYQNDVNVLSMDGDIDALVNELDQSPWRINERDRVRYFRVPFSYFDSNFFFFLLQNEYTPLLHACEKGYVEIYKILITRNADINSKNNV